MNPPLKSLNVSSSVIGCQLTENQYELLGRLTAHRTVGLGKVDFLVFVSHNDLFPCQKLLVSEKLVELKVYQH